MKKHILISFVIISMIPSFAFAAWWNPLTWKIFKRAAVTTIQAPISTPSSTEVMVKNQAIEIDKLKKEVDGFKQKVNPIAVVAKSAASKVDKKAPTQIIPEENFNGQLTELYQKKIAFLKKSISLKEIGILANKLGTQSIRDDISFSEDNLSTYGNSYSPSWMGLVTNALNFWKYAVAERVAILTLEQDRIDFWNDVKEKLEKELADITPQKAISETEYDFRKFELNKLVDEDNLDKAYADQDIYISDKLTFLNKNNDEFHALLLSVAKKEKAETDREIAAINAELEIIRSRPIPAISVSITPDQLQPTRVSCETMHRVNGNPSTTCIEFPSMKSMTCDTRYNVSGNAIKDCYFH